MSPCTRACDYLVVLSGVCGCVCVCIYLSGICICVYVYVCLSGFLCLSDGLCVLTGDSECLCPQEQECVLVSSCVCLLSVWGVTCVRDVHLCVSGTVLPGCISMCCENHRVSGCVSLSGGVCLDDFVHVSFPLCLGAPCLSGPRSPQCWAVQLTCLPRPPLPSLCPRSWEL